MDEETEATPEETKAAAGPKTPSLLRNYVSFIGGAIAAAAGR